MAGKLAILAAALVLALPAAAQGATYCVNAPGCAGTSQPTLGDALAAAADMDRIELGAGAYAGPFSTARNVTIAGAGPGRTVLTSAADGMPVLKLDLATAAVRGMTVRLGGPNQTGIMGGAAEDVAIDRTAAATNPVGYQGTSFKRGTIDLGDVPGGVGIAAAGEVADATVRANVGIAAGGAPAIRRTAITAVTGINAMGGATTVDNVAIELLADPLAAGLRITAMPPLFSSALLRNVTIAGRGLGDGLTVSAGPALPGMPTSVSVSLADSVITGLPIHIRATGSSCFPGDPTCTTPSTAGVTASYSAYDPARVLTNSGGFVSGPPTIAADPGLRADLRPRFDSPLVDAADPATGGDRDAAGETRVADGDGAGGARADIGAYEYQRRPPVASGAFASPGEARVGQPITFGVAATDPEGEPVTAAWTFSDGTAATGLEVQHAFAAPGQVRGTVTLTDAAGASTSASVTATVSGDAAPGGPPPAGGKVTPLKLTLRAAKQRDKRAPYRFALRGRLQLPAGAACDGGTVRLSVRAGKRRLTRHAALRADCTFSATLRLGRKRARRVVVTPRFAGTDALAPLTGAALRLRAG